MRELSLSPLDVATSAAGQVGAEKLDVVRRLTDARAAVTAADAEFEAVAVRAKPAPDATETAGPPGLTSRVSLHQILDQAVGDRF